MASTIDKVKHALHLDKSTSTTHTAGTHDANHHYGRDAAVGVGAVGIGEHEHHKHEARAGHGNVTTGQTTTAGPHSSNLANKLDPRVDSDLSNQTGTANHHYGRDAAVGAGGVGLASHEHRKHEGVSGHGTTTGTGHHYGRDAAVGAGGVGLAEHEHRKHETAGHPTTAGPHSSSLLNKLDPRVNSAQHGATGGGIGSTSGHNNSTFGNTGTTGGISNSTNAGPHNSNLANKLDPRVDSDLSGRGNNHGATSGLTSGTHATPGSGTAQNTAGPHHSDLLNKLDPRVDADLDGSKTVGGNRTHY